MGDMLVVRTKNYGECRYRALTWKTYSALKWLQLHVQFEVLLKADDETVVHVNRLWQWLLLQGRACWRKLYARDEEKT